MPDHRGRPPSGETEPQLPAIFAASTRSWFEETFEAPSPVQSRGWPIIARSANALLLAPTGSGKTLAAFLWALDRIGRLPDDAEPGVRVVYVSPLKALVYDVDRNLREPLAGIERAAELLGHPHRPIRVSVRTGDTPQRDRQRMIRHPPDVLVTTPESLYLMLGSRVGETLAACEVVIVDEIHALAASKRGAHLALSLERLAALCPRDPQRIGLSATVSPVESVAAFLGGRRPVEIADTSAVPNLALSIEMPALQPATDRPSGALTIWPDLERRLLEVVLANRTTIVFVNNRGATERIVRQLNEAAAAEIALAHHGSLSRSRREEVEALLKAGRVRAIIATSSLELGIDMGAVDQVIMIESPGAVARGLQRAGRAGHRVGQTSHATILPKHKGDLLECTVVAQGMLEGALEPLSIPRNALDVLAQQVVAMCGVRDRSRDELAEIVRGAYPYAELPPEGLDAVLDMLSGRYPSTAFADLRPRLSWDRSTGILSARRGAKLIAQTNAGTIPDRGLYGVHLGEKGPRIGELDEEMVHEARPGQTFVLGASTWRIESVTRDRVVVSPAPGEQGTLPFWHGARPGRPVGLGRRMGAFLRELEVLGDDEVALDWLSGGWPLDRHAAAVLLGYLREQQEATGRLPTDRTIVVECFPDEIGDLRVCILSPYGTRVHAPWALALEAQLSSAAGFEVSVMWSDDGIVLRFTGAMDLQALGEGDLSGPLRWAPEPEAVEGLVTGQLAHSALFAGLFRENAGRALLLPRRRPGQRTALWAQRRRAESLLAVARQYPSFPIVLETYRACLKDVFDLPALQRLLGSIRAGEVAVHMVETPRASPFARSLVFDYVAAWLYEGDAPLAERRAQALTIDRELLRDLLGHAELRELLDADAIEAVVAELQSLAEGYQATDPDRLGDLLRRLGDLTGDELAARCVGDHREWLTELRRAHRAVELTVDGEERWVSAPDVALFRDALSADVPSGLPDALLGPVDGALGQLLGRYARTRGPFESAELVRRYGVSAAIVEAELAAAVRSGTLHRGEFRPGGVGPEWCDPDVLRRIRRRTLASLRGAVAPVAAQTLGRFLPAWQHIDEPPKHFEELLEQLEGLPLAFTELRGRILPARWPVGSDAELDRATASGDWVWVGQGAIGARDGRVALYARQRASQLLPRADGTWEPAGELQAALVNHLRERGASFYFELMGAAPGRTADAERALWDLVWSGIVTCDTLQPLRAPTRGRPRSGRRRGTQNRQAGGGRWWLVETLRQSTTRDTERLHAWAETLLCRYGMVARECLASESAEAGAAPYRELYPVLKAMDEVGRIRRGYFVEGLGGAQFASAEAVDTLRASRDVVDGGRLAALAATDPACPWGAALAWPGVALGAAQARREVGATVVLQDGVVVLHLSRSGRRLTVFSEPADLLQAIRLLLRSHPRRSFDIELLDPVSPDLEPTIRSALLRAGLREEYRGLRWEAPAR